MKLSGALLSLVLAKVAMAARSALNPNLPEAFAKHYVPSTVNTNTVKFPRLQYCEESSSETTLISIDGVVVPMMADAGWYTVTYGGQYTYADQILAVYNKQTAILSLTACFCPGNLFQVFDNGTPITLTDAGCDYDEYDLTPSDCDNRVTTPGVCFGDSNYCHGQAVLDPGFHNITIGVLNSPWTAGAAYIRLDTACKITSGSPDPVLGYLEACCGDITDALDCTQAVIE